jgi:alkylation response protein AidB-like acyl-CoA dehydrogenase
MDLRFTPEENAFRMEVREFFRKELPEDIRCNMVLGRRPTMADIRRWMKILNQKGWCAPHWPKQYGGAGWTPAQRYIFLEEAHQAPAPEALSFNVNMVGPVLIHYGTPEQKAKFLPSVLNADIIFCQGFSEPGAGSDLAALKTSARRDGDHYVINGQKIWTSECHEADWMFALVRTSNEGKKQEGITFLLIDVNTPGITVRPIISMDGYHEQNEVFFDDVRVPVENLVHEENKGWDVAKFLLGNERAGQARVGQAKDRIRHAKRLAREIPVGDKLLADDDKFREKLAAFEVEAKAMEMTQLRLIAQMSKEESGGKPKPDSSSSILKIKSAEVRQGIQELLMQMAGPQGMPWQPELIDATPGIEPIAEDWATVVAPNYFFGRAMAIFGGATEIQKNILAKAFLGL